MYDIQNVAAVVRECRAAAWLTQSELAARAASSQSGIARIEEGSANPTVRTLSRIVNAAGFDLRVTLVPRPAPDPVIERYKQDVDRSLLRENLRRTIDERLRSLADWQRDSRALQQAVRAARVPT